MITFIDFPVMSIHTPLDYHVKIMNAPSSIEIEGNYYMLESRDIDDKV